MNSWWGVLWSIEFEGEQSAAVDDGAKLQHGKAGHNVPDGFEVLDFVGVLRREPAVRPEHVDRSHCGVETVSYLIGEIAREGGLSLVMLQNSCPFRQITPEKSSLTGTKALFVSAARRTFLSITSTRSKCPERT